MSHAEIPAARHTQMQILSFTILILLIHISRSGVTPVNDLPPFSPNEPPYMIMPVANVEIVDGILNTTVIRPLKAPSTTLLSIITTTTPRAVPPIDAILPPSISRKPIMYPSEISNSPTARGIRDAIANIATGTLPIPITFIFLRFANCGTANANMTANTTVITARPFFLRSILFLLFIDSSTSQSSLFPECRLFSESVLPPFLPVSPQSWYISPRAARVP